MSRSGTQKTFAVALCAAFATSFLFFSSDAWAQSRTTRAADGTDCLVVTGAPPTDAPRVLGSRQPMQEEYGFNDTVFIGGPGVGDLVVGQRLQFVRDFGTVRAPDTGEVITDAIGWLGFAEVTEVGSDRAIVRIIKSCREVEVGDFLATPDERPVADADDFQRFDPLELVTPDEADPSVILGSLESVLSLDGEARTGNTAQEAYSQRDVIIIDQGESSGWSAGDQVRFYRGELGLNVRTSVTVDTYTPLVLAYGLVVATGDEAAAVLIVEGDLDVTIGDRVRRLSTNDR